MAQIKPLDIYLDFFSKDIVSIPCTQYDKDARTLIIHLLDKGKTFNLDSTRHVLLFKMTKKDNTKILNEASINSDGTATYVITEQSCIYAGVYDIQFMLIDISDETIIHTMPAKLSITQTVADNVQIESSNEFNALNNLFTDLQSKLYNHYFVLTEDKDIANGVPSLDENTKIPLNELYEATTASKGITLLTDSVNSSSTTTAATPNSVKTVNDNLISEISRATNAENNLDSKKLDKTTVASSNTLGLVKSGNDITVDSSGNVSVNDYSHNHTVSNISDLTATASEINVLDGITASTTELNYTNGVTSNIQTQLNSKSDTEHTHDNRYYTQNETDTKLNTKAPLASPAFTGTPKAPTASADTNTTQLATTAFVQTATSKHNTSATAHSDIRDLISELTTRLNALADSDDITLDQLSEIVAYIKSNRTLIENVTTNKVNVSDIVDNLISTATNKPLSANQGRLLAGGSARDDTKLPLSGGQISNDNKSMDITPSGLSGDSSQSISDFYKIEADTFEGKLIGNVEGNAASASALDVSATGSATQPVYFTSDGVPKACTYTLAKSVPSNAVFTDTHHSSGTVINNSATSTSNTTSALTNGNVYLNHIENGAVKNSHKIVGSGAITVTSDENGNITINSANTSTGTDTKVTQTVTSGNASYPLLLAPSGQTATATTTSYFDSGVTLNPSTNTIAANISGNAAAATKLATAKTINGTSFDGSSNITTANWGTSRTIQIGDTSKSINGSANYTWNPSEIGYRHEWSCIVTCDTWSRLCYVGYGSQVVGTKYILNIAGTRGGVVYSSTFLVTTHHPSKGRIIKLAGSTYSEGSNGYQVRILSDSSGNSYFELYDALANAANSTTQIVYCRLIPIFCGTITKYTSFTSGATLPTNFAAAHTLTINGADMQGNISGNSDTATKLATARTIQTNLASTSSASFDGSGNIAPGVLGTLPIANGGTGASTAANARANLGLGSASTYSATTSIASGSSSLITSGSVYNAINNLVTSIYDDTNVISRTEYSNTVPQGAFNYYILKFNNGIMIQTYNIATSGSHTRVYSIVYPISFINSYYTIMFNSNCGDDIYRTSPGQCYYQGTSYGDYYFYNSGSGNGNGYTESCEFYTLTLIGRWK